MTTKFWWLDSPDSLRGLADWDDGVDLEQVRCPLTKTHDRAGKRTTDLMVVLASRRVADFVWTWGSSCLIQDRVLHLLQENGFTGFEVKPVTARFKRRAVRPAGPGASQEADGADPVPKLWELVVTGWGGMARPESGVSLKRSCIMCGWLVYRGFTDPAKLIDEDQWDGSDFFMVWPYPRYTFVTERVVDFVRTQKLTGVRFLAPESLSTAVDGASPGRLSYWMPEERARELGEPLGIY